MAAFTDAALNYLLRPFQSIDSVIAHLSGPLTALTDLNSKSAWLYLISGLFIAWPIFYYEKRAGRLSSDTTFLRYVFLKEIYLHPSAILDYKFLTIDFALKSLTYLPFILGLNALTYKLCLALVPGSVAPRGIASATLMTFVIAFLLMDFGFFLSHYVMHRIPWLWDFHQVHHSALVLTPMTVHRIHPVETLVSGIVSSLLSAVAAAAYTILSDEDLNFITLFGVNALTFAFFLTGNVLRHTHIWLSYGPWLSWIFISPAQHQIHHSVDPKHWDKNFGYIFAIWDALFGSLYVPRKRETLRFGLPHLPPEEYSTVPQLYFKPFTRTLARLTPISARALSNTRR